MIILILLIICQIFFFFISFWSFSYKNIALNIIRIFQDLSILAYFIILIIIYFIYQNFLEVPSDEYETL
jgi:hypothetical protein